MNEEIFSLLAFLKWDRNTEIPMFLIHFCALGIQEHGTSPILTLYLGDNISPLDSSAVLFQVPVSF